MINQTRLPHTLEELKQNNFETKYQKIKTLGKGQFGTVYKVKSKIDNQIYAAKKLFYKSDER